MRTGSESRNLETRVCESCSTCKRETDHGDSVMGETSGGLELRHALSLRTDYAVVEASVCEHDRLAGSRMYGRLLSDECDQVPWRGGNQAAQSVCRLRSREQDAVVL